jgi:hypothetical protein
VDDEEDIARWLRGLDLPDVEDDREGGPDSTFDDLGELGGGWGEWK